MANQFTALKSGLPDIVQTSPDGATWTPKLPTLEYWRNNILFENGVYVTRMHSNDYVYQSLDGIHWSPIDLPSDLGHQLQSISFGAGLFVGIRYTGITGYILTSVDGITWTIPTFPAGRYHSVVYGGGQFVAVSSGTGAYIATSPDGLAWTAQTSPDANAWYGVAYGNGIYVAVALAGTANRAMTSPDGVTWTPRAMPFVATWRDVAFGAGVFAACVQQATPPVSTNIATSTDGITWTPQTTSSQQFLTRILFGAEQVAPTIFDLVADIGNAAADGYGTISSPYSKFQLNIRTGSYSSYSDFASDLLLKGQCIFPVAKAPYGTYQEPNVYWEYFAPGSRDNISMRGLDLSLYGPPSWYNPRYQSGPFNDDWYTEFYPLDAGSDIAQSDLVISQSGIEIDAYDTSGGEIASIVTKNCYFDFTSYMLTISYAATPVTWKWLGCTFVARNFDYPYLEFGDGDPDTTYEITDCAFLAEGWTPIAELLIYIVTDQPVTFTNCYFAPNIYIYDNNGNEWDLNDGAPIGLVDVTFVDCTYNHDFGSTAPTALIAVPGSKTAFDYTSFNIPEETDPTILARWVSDDYNTGLFGEARLGAGAFYFPGIPPMIWNHVETNRPEADLTTTVATDCTFDSTVPISLLPEPFDAEDFRQEDFIYATFGFVNQGSG